MFRDDLSWKLVLPKVISVTNFYKAFLADCGLKISSSVLGVQENEVKLKIYVMGSQDLR